MTQVIRRAVIADLDALTRLRIDFLQDAHGDAPLPIEFTETTRRFLADRLAESGSLVFWVAERDGQIVAQAMISLFQRLPNLSNPSGLEAYVSNFYIDATYRRQGVGTALLQALVADARDRGVGRLWLYASQAVEGLYAGAGFEHVVRAVPEMEHRRAHVHVIGNGCETVFRLNCPNGPPQLRENFGFARTDVTHIEAKLTAGLGIACDEWERIHGDA